MKYLLIVSFYFFSFFAIAQQGSIRGVVIDDTGMPIPGVTVIIKGSNQGTLTDFDGNYVLDSVDPEDVIVFSFLGFSDQEFTIGDRTSLDVLLREELQQLDEVVVIGYGEVKKSDVTGAISSVDVDGIEETGANNITQVLEGRSTGVQVRNNIGIPGAETDIIIRGRSSISTNSAPLYVVDGVLIDAAVPTSFFATPVNPLQTISSEDIESIQVLKDASATAIYGSRGANGVILITTKGGKSGNTRIFFNTSTASTSILRKVDVLSPEEYAVANNDNYQRFLDAGLNVSDFRRFPTDASGNILSDSLQYYNWQDIMLRNAVRQSYRLGVSGGQDNNTFYVAGGLSSTDGIVQSTGMKSYDLTGNFKNRVNDWLTADIRLSATKTENNMTQGSDGSKNKFGVLNSIISTRPVYGNDEDLFAEGEEYLTADDQINGQSNPYAWIDEYQDLVDIENLRMSTSLDAKISNSLTFRSRIGTQYRNTHRQMYFSSNHNRGRQSNGEGHKFTRKDQSVVLDNLFFYKSKIGKKHNLSGTLGFTYNEYSTSNVNITASNFIDDYSLGDDISSGAVQNITDDKSGYSIMSYLARANYRFKNLFDITVTFRADGSSKFQPGNQWGYFPAFAGAYNLHRTSLLRKLSFVSRLKLRAGWGQVGNSLVPPYATIDQFGYVLGSDDTGAPVTILQPTSKGNPDLTWELAEQTNIALDFGFLNNRVLGSLDVYYKKTQNQLFNQPLPASAGFTSQWINFGEVENKGIEGDLDYVAITSKDINLKIGGNISVNRNKILRLDQIANDFGQKSFFGPRVNDFNVNTPANIFMEGMAVGLFYGYKTDGIVQQGDTDVPTFNGVALRPGDYKFIDIRGGGDDLSQPDGNVDVLDKEIIGDPNPDFTYAFSGDFSYKNFTLSFLFSGVYGSDILNGTFKRANFALASDFKFNSNVHRDNYYNAWTPENQSNTFPRIGHERQTVESQILDVDIEDGSYLKLQNVTIGYNLKLPKSNVQSVRLYLTGQNLLYWTKYSGLNPEVGRSGSGLFGVDMNQWPVAKSFQLGLNVTL